MARFTPEQREVLESVVSALRGLAHGITVALRQSEALRLALMKKGLVAEEEWTAALQEWEAARSVEDVFDPVLRGLDTVCESLLRKIRS